MSVRKYIRLTRRLIRSFIGKDAFYLPEVRFPRLHLGNLGASFTINPDLLNQESVVYSFGVGTDISFDLALIQQFSIKVHAFDPTPRSISWISTQYSPQAFHFLPYGLADFDGTATFDPPIDPTHVSYSLIERKHPGKVNCAVYRLQTIMNMLGHTSIDLLKMDIEGAEYGAILDLLNSKLNVTQICVEFHHRWPEIGPGKTKEAVKALRHAGYRIFDVSPTGEEYSFIHLR
jgi:FkbM family methyltransferase